MLSAVVVVSGNDDDRKRNFRQFLSCVEHQVYNDYELIIVEQCVDGQFYKEIRPKGVLYRYCALEGAPFALCWCRNVGARVASGDVLVHLDADVVFGPGYFSVIMASFVGPYSLGWDHFAWLNEIGTLRYYEERRHYRKWPKGSVKWQRGPLFGDAMQGGSAVFNKSWFFDVFGGYCEDFANWGGSDCEAINRARLIADPNAAILYTLAHLYHQRRLPRRTENQNVLALSRDNPMAFAEALVKAGVGKLNGPSKVIRGGTLL